MVAVWLHVVAICNYDRPCRGMVAFLACQHGCGSTTNAGTRSPQPLHIFPNFPPFRALLLYHTNFSLLVVLLVVFYAFSNTLCLST
jgi:hypothetical protein